MRWSLTWGEKAAGLIQAATDAGVPPPESAVPPPLPDRLVPFIEDYWTLSTCRSFTPGGAGPIPWTAIDQFAERNGYANNILVYEDFIAFIQALDHEYLTVMNEETEKMTRKAEAQSGR